MDQIKQKIEQANMDKKIAELQSRDTSDIERKIEVLTKQQDALYRMTHGNIAAASNASRTPQYPRPFLPGSKGQWVTPSSTGPVKDCSAQIKEIERLQRLLKDAIEKMERMSLGARSSVGGKKSRSKKTRRKKSRSKKTRRKKSRSKKTRRNKSRSKKTRRNKSRSKK